MPLPLFPLTPLPPEPEPSDTTPITDDEEDEDPPDEDEDDEIADPDPTMLPIGFIADSDCTFDNVKKRSNVKRLVIVRAGNSFVRRAGLVFKDIWFMVA